MELSAFQSKILKAVEDRTRAKKKKGLLVEALAGAGKSTMIWLICKLLQAQGFSPQEVTALVFGRKNQDDLHKKIEQKVGSDWGVVVRTLHSLELEESETACRRLQEGSEVIRSCLEQYVDIVFTDCSSASVYLDSRFKGQIDLHRLTKIIHWRAPVLDESAIFESLREYKTHLDLREPKQTFQWRHPAMKENAIFEALVALEFDLEFFHAFLKQ